MRRLYPALIVCLLAMLLFSCNDREKRFAFDGFVQGTYYHIVVYAQDTANLRQGFDSIFTEIDNTFSLWNKKSMINRLNNNEDVELNAMFVENFNAARKINILTDGALDVTVGSIVQAYGFANKEKQTLSDTLLDSLLCFVGMDKVRIEKDTDSCGNYHLIKSYKQTQLDFNSIAQGYTSDLIGKYLLKKGIRNFVVDVGGEVVCKGEKPGKKPWNVAIETPSENSDSERTYTTTVNLKDKSIVTSGSYRKFYVENGIKYSHTIDPKTARSVRHSLLSASVIAQDATTADGLATAFMVMGVEKVKTFLQQHKEYAAYLIYSDEKGRMLTWQSDNFSQYLDK